MELLGDMDHVESCFGPLGDNVSASARYEHGLCQTYHRLKNHFGHTRWYSKETRLKSKLVLVYLEIVLTLTQDGCTFCAKHTISSKIILDAPDGTPSFGPFEDSANLDAR
jgi:hypothetical protein